MARMTTDTHREDSVSRRRSTNDRLEKGVLLCTALAISIVLVPERPALTLGGAMALLVLTAVVCLRPTDASLRAVLFADILAGCFALYVFGSWPPGLVTAMFVAVPLAVGIACHRAGRLRPVAPWLTWGRWTGRVWWLFAITVVVSIAALTVWKLNSTPNLSEYLSDIRERPVWLVVVGITGFALVNAA